jgi:hypothetical protein
MVACDGMVDGIVATWVRFESECHPPKVYPLRVGSAGAVIAEPGWAVMAVIAVPPLVLKVMVTFAIDEDDDGMEEDELDDEVVVALLELELELGVTDEDAVEDELEVTELELELGVTDEDAVEDELEVTELELELGVTDEDAVEDEELDVIDDVEELEDGVVVELEDVSIGVEDVGTEFDVSEKLGLEEEFDNVIKPRAPIAVTITDPPINQNQKGFLRFLSVSSTTSMTFSMMVLSSFMVNISFKDG